MFIFFISGVGGHPRLSLVPVSKGDRGMIIPPPPQFHLLPRLYFLSFKMLWRQRLPKRQSILYTALGILAQQKHLNFFFFFKFSTTDINNENVINNEHFSVLFLLVLHDNCFVVLLVFLRPNFHFGKGSEARSLLACLWIDFQILIWKKRGSHFKKNQNPRINWCVFKEEGAQSWFPTNASKAHTVKIWMCTSHCYHRKANPVQRAWLIWKTWNMFNVWWNMICKAYSYFCHCRLYQFYMLTKVWPRDIYFTH